MQPQIFQQRSEDHIIASAQVFTGMIVSQFQSKFQLPFDLTVPENFLRLTEVADLRKWATGLKEKGHPFLFSRYDVAALLCQHHLKERAPTLLGPDQHSAFISAVFPKIYSWDLNETPRRLTEIEHLLRNHSEDNQLYELKLIRDEWNKIIDTRDEAINLCHQKYELAFDDAFHNPMLEFSAPTFASLADGSICESLTQIREKLLEHQRSRGNS